MQEQQYEGFAYESEIAYGRQGMRDIWSEGEKLRPEPQRPKKQGGILPSAMIVLVTALLVAVFLLGGMFATFSGSHEIKQAVPIQKSYPMPIKPYPAPIQKPNPGLPIQQP